MGRSLKELFNTLKTPELPVGLAPVILARIGREQKKRLEWTAGAFLALDLASLTGLVWVAVYLGNLVAQSGFYDYLSLLWSDSGLMPLIWQETISALADSLPALALAGFLAVVFIFVWSVGETFYNLKSIKRLA